MTADNQVTLEPVAWMYRYVVQYAPKLECAKRLPDKIAFSIARWTDAEARHWTETPLYAQPAINSGGEVDRMRDEAAKVAFLYADKHQGKPAAVHAWKIGNAIRALAAMDRAPGVEICGWCRKPVTECAGYGRHDNVYGEQCAQPEPRPVEAGEVERIVEQLGPYPLRLKRSEDYSGEHREWTEEVTVYKGSSFFEQVVKDVLATHRQQSLLAARAEIEGLKDPNVVHVNLLRGSIARPTLAQIIHIYGAQQLRAALSTDQGREGK